MTQPLAQFHPDTQAWFSRTLGTPTAVQVEGWPAIASGANVLISAPTGTGKTLSAFLVAIDRLKQQVRAGALEDTLQILYISPLKALAGDIRENLRRPLEGIAGPQLRIAVRTGDTSQTDRARMYKNPPHILITTPESLYLLLTSINGKKLLQTANTVILDELHALIGSKRGAHLMLSLARLDALCGTPLQRIGLSATVEPLTTASQYLCCDAPVQIIAPKMKKRTDIVVQSVLPDMRVLPHGTIWPELARHVLEHSESARTIIAFTEGRAAAERLAFNINKIAGEGYARTHHGCVSKEQRHQAEQQLRSGDLRVLCATSSMELGIDVGEVDLVLQIGAPRSVASTMQRLGRAGHNPSRTSVMYMLPRMASEGLACGLAADAALAGGIEHAAPPRKCLDVLAQHLVSMATDDGYCVDEVMQLLTHAYNFREVTRAEVLRVLEMLAGDYEHKADHPVRPRILYDRIHETVQGDAYSRMLAVSAAGTIPDRGWFPVLLPDGTKLGELDEEYVFEARVGHKFFLGAFAWRIAQITRDKVVVQPDTPAGAHEPFWKGDATGRDYRTAKRYGEKQRQLTQAYRENRLHEALREMCLDEAAAFNTADVLVHQIEETGQLPDDKTLLLEHFEDENGSPQVMIHSIFGRRVNLGLSLLLQNAVQKVFQIQTSAYEDDEGILLFPYAQNKTLPQGILQLLDAKTARQTLGALLPKTALFNINFRYTASRALMMGVRSGKRVPLWLQRLRSAQVLDETIDQAEHPLVAETCRECLEDFLDIPAIEEVLQNIASGEIAVRELQMDYPSMLSLPLRRQAEAMAVYDYTPKSSHVLQTVEENLALTELLPPPQAQLQEAARRRREPQDAVQLHSLLMMEGDICFGETQAPADWFEQLATQGRASYIEPGLWICAEQQELYILALVQQDSQALTTVVRRCLRYRGAQDAASLAARYCLPQAAMQQVLHALAAEELAVLHEGLYYHRDIYTRAQRENVYLRREQAVTLPPEHYSRFLLGQRRIQAPPAQQLRHAMLSLEGRGFSPRLWEEVILPARVDAYHPGLLDTFLAQGELFWQMLPGERLLLCFYPQQQIDWDAPFATAQVDLPDLPQKILQLLQQRGASFPQALSAQLDAQPVMDALYTLMQQGLVRADSFVPVRQWLQQEQTKKQPAKRQAKARVATMTAGRWECVRGQAVPDMQAQLAQILDRGGILCRETAPGLSWMQALEVLRVWEFSGRVRRGYFIQGLSGAQFIRTADYDAVLARLQAPQPQIVWLNAQDPAQAWGSVLPHMQGREFLLLSSNAVAIHEGRPVAVFEQNGAVLRVFETALVHEVLAAFTKQYQAKQIYGTRRSITCKHYPKEAETALQEAGFVRQMLDYILWPNLRT